MSNLMFDLNGEGGIRTPDEPKPIIDFESVKAVIKSLAG